MVGGHLDEAAALPAMAAGVRRGDRWATRYVLRAPGDSYYHSRDLCPREGLLSPMLSRRASFALQRSVVSRNRKLARARARHRLGSRWSESLGDVPRDSDRGPRFGWMAALGRRRRTVGIRESQPLRLNPSGPSKRGREIMNRCFSDRHFPLLFHGPSLCHGALSLSLSPCGWCACNGLQDVAARMRCKRMRRHTRC